MKIGSEHIPDLAQVADDTLSEVSGELALGSTHLPQAVKDSYDDYKASIADMISAGRQYEADSAELSSKADLIPQSGLNRLRAESKQAAQDRAAEAGRRGDKAFEMLKSELTEAALPRVDASREALARDEFRTVLAGEDGLNKVFDLASRGSYEASAVLFSPFARTAMEAAGMSGKDIDDTLATARTLAADAAAVRGRTPRELIAGSSLGRVGKLGAAKFAASAYLRDVLGP